MSALTERALFDAYRRVDDYAAECACGEQIVAATGAEDVVGEAIRVHQESTVHQQWQVWQEAVHALQRPTRRPCPCHMHGAA